MNRAQPFAHDSDSNFDPSTSAHEQAQPASDPFGPVVGWNGSNGAGPSHEAFAAPVFASPSIVPSAGFPSPALSSADFDAASYDYEEDAPRARKKPTWLIAAGALAVIAGVSFTGLHFAEQSRLDEQRVAEVEQIRQRMVELDAKRRAEEAARSVDVAQDAAGSSSVAALLAASTHSHGAAGIITPDAEKPRGRAAALRAAAIKRALSAPAVSRHTKATRRGGSAKRSAPKDEAEGLHESSSNDPIYGL